jgi:predicted nucleotidyltransferase
MAMIQPSERLSLHEMEAIEAFMQRLLAACGQDVIDVRLFGSKARGQARPDSDLDLLVLVDRSDYALKHDILWLAAEISLAYDVLLSPRVIPYAAWHEMAQGETLFYRTVHAESIPLFATE